ncbi:NAD-binding protein [Arthrobacter sp. lap29]|uniref:NAD-binding protein n=1 Tax=Arthrobacter sp. lap29 TaxID=3056122 RepID=UPI0028F6E897|nr:NAD-binding protein [Arthrobacter sp. lap29]
MAVVAWIGLGNMGGPMAATNAATTVKAGRVGHTIRRFRAGQAPGRKYYLQGRGRHRPGAVPGERLPIDRVLAEPFPSESLGLGKQVFWDIGSVSAGDSWALRTWYPISGVVPTSAANSNFAPSLTAELANKDRGLALAAAPSANTPLGRGEPVQAMLQRLTRQGLTRQGLTRQGQGTKAREPRIAPRSSSWWMAPCRSLPSVNR